LKKLHFIFLAITSVFLLSCTEDPAPFEYIGDGGVPVPFAFESLTPEIEVILPSGQDSFVLDTGSPINLGDVGHFDESAGIYSQDISTLGLLFPSCQIVYEDWLDNSAPIAGLIGGNILKYFNWEIDYPSRTVTLFTGDFSENTDLDSQVSFQLSGGGLFKASNGDTMTIGATRHLVWVNIEGQRLLGLLDTGASYMVVSDSLINSLGWENRPDHGSITVVTVNGPVAVPLTELFNIAFDDAITQTKVENIYASVMPDVFFDEIYRETGKVVELLIGGSFMRHFKMKFATSERIIYLTPPVTDKSKLIDLPTEVRFPITLEPIK
jgi:predicted aspartyl protease